jgi:hypothetical protein
MPSALKRENPALQKIKFVNFFLFLWVIFALKRENPAMQKIKFVNFFLFLWVILVLLDWIQFGSGYTTLVAIYDSCTTART